METDTSNSKSTWGKPMRGEEALKNPSPCIGHDKMAQIEEQNERLKKINDKIVLDKAARIFESGAKRDSNENKPFCHMIRGYTRQRIGYHLNLGAKSYGNNNFLLGIPTETYLESLDRHLASFMEGNRDEDHLAAIFFGIQGCMLNEQKEGIPADHYFKLKQK